MYRSSRRHFLVAGTSLMAAVPRAAAEKKRDDDVPPTEDLMREHGVLRRILLVYREAIRRLDAHEVVAVDSLGRAAAIVREFIEDYHEKDEETFIFPRFETAGRLVDLVGVLRAQHAAGKKLTAQILRAATPGALKDDGARKQLVEPLRLFIRMYEPHAAREDTVLFPAFRELLNDKELKKLQELFEQKEKALPHGDFEKVLSEVANIERTFGLADLATFTPG